VNILKLTIPVVVLLLSACSWVDSTGAQGTTAQAAPAVVDPTLLLLDLSDSFSIEENTQRTIAFNGPDNRISDWTWNLLEGQGNIDQCQGIDGFDQSIASNSLSQSCADDANCTVNIQELVADEVTRFEITTPQFRVPAALEFRFTAQSEAGDFLEQRQTLCAIPINNPPTPADDSVSVMRGTLLQIDGDGPQSLLANDTDDEDIRNQPLQIDPTPVRAPRFANRFELFSDGGFIYEPLSSAPVSANGSVSDSFTYLATDGNEFSSATVNIKISDFNTAPMLTSEVPDIEVSVSDTDRDPEITFLQSYFSDAENDILIFSVADGDLPESGNITLTSDGALEGFASEEDGGLYFVNVTVSDSMESIDVSFFLNIVRDTESNKAPFVDDISNETVEGEFSYDVSVFFSDADDDVLFYTATNLPPGVEISADGVITGTSSSDNRGTWLIRVAANDGNGGISDDGFRLRIE